MNEYISKHHTTTTIAKPSTQASNTPVNTDTKSTSTSATIPPSNANTSSNKTSDTTNINAKIETLVNLLREKGQIQAEVKSSQLIDNKAQQLLNKTNPSLASQIQSQQQTSQATPQGTKQAITTSAMYLVKLSQMTNTNSNTNTNTNTYQKNQLSEKSTLLTTVTPVAFKKGDVLQLQLNTLQQITIKPTVSGVRPAIAEGLKTALSQQQSSSQLLNTLIKLDKLPVALQEILLSKNTLQQLKTLSSFTYNQDQLSTPQQVKQALSHSGLFVENKLQQQQPLLNDLRIVLGGLNKILSQELSNQGMNQGLLQNTDNTVSKATFDQMLVQLIQQLPQQAAGVKMTAENVAQQVTTILQLLGLKINPDAQVDLKKIRDIANKQINRMNQGAQEKIHLNQLRSLGVDSQNVDSSVTYSANKANAFITEIALRWGEQILPVQINITEEREEKKDNQAPEKNKDEKRITRRWQVFMSFDLPNNDASNTTLVDKPIDTLHSQLTIVDDTISATLWSESPRLCHKAKQHFTQLRNALTAQGLHVDELHCINGKPPNQEVSLDYHLVDIVT